MDDLVMRGGEVIDGSGAPGRVADVVVTDGRIIAIDHNQARQARRIIDATGQVVAPGFIDIHTHSDFTLPLNQRAESKIRQGVTTEVLGNCGFSAAPALPGRVEMLRDYLVEQFYRDNRLNAIHEGTHGIQALDLLGRKVVMEEGAALRLLGERFEDTIGRIAEAAKTFFELSR